MPGIGGAETYMMCLAHELYTQGHETTIICSGRKAHECTIDNVKIIHKVCPKSNIIALPLLFLKSIGYIIRNRKNIDVVNYQSIFLAFLPGWIARLAHCKVCYTIHSLAEDNPKHNAIMKFIMKLAAFISIWLCGKNIVTVSHSKALEIKKRYGKKCAVIPCGININDSAAETDILERYGIKKGNYYLSIGRIDPIKNLDILVKSFIKHNSNDKQLVIAGNYDTEYGRNFNGACCRKQEYNIYKYSNGCRQNNLAKKQLCRLPCFVVRRNADIPTRICHLFKTRDSNKHTCNKRSNS